MVIAESHRTIYHAALAHGSNRLVTLVEQASQLLAEMRVEAPDRMLGSLLGRSWRRGTSSRRT
ncbi:putative short-subunit dehydrogenase-like oxidoreductase (DUF2520 family) [Arthrobacter globiformis]|nr:putative short-subunit dehydrogenase-like oxidoreductase (DUF2520 family) [Arthrobacter globiformis]